jgi:23S rRNA (uracil1939-C5)-methyltransferase
VASTLKASMRELQLTSYSDASHEGLLRAVQVVVERSSQSAQIVLVCNAPSLDSAEPLLAALQRRLGAQVHSLWWNGNSDVTNRVMGPLFLRFAGAEHVVERIGGADVFFPPGAFGQNNLELFDLMVEQIHANVPAGSHVVELYAGAGAIGLGLVQRGEAVVFNELGEASLAGLARGLEQLSLEQRQRVQVAAGPAESAALHIRRDSVVIVDPPRKGLDPEVVAALGVRAPEQLLYVSCGLTSFLRDTALLTAQGLALDSVTAYDLFPYTQHIETLASFRRRSAVLPQAPRGETLRSVPWRQP